MTREHFTENVSMAERMFGAAISFNHGSDLERVDFYDLDEAYWIVACGGNLRTHIGRQPLYVMADIDGYGHQRDTSMGKYYLARDQVVRAIFGQRLQLYGVIWARDLANTGAGQVFRVTPDKIDNLEAFEEDEPISFQGVKFDLLVVDADSIEMLFAFGPSIADLLKSTGGTPPLEHATRSKSTPILGRPRKWNWEHILQEVAVLANTPDGLPEKQADLEKWVCERCQDLFGAEPSLSQIRKKISPIYQAMRSKGS